MVTANEPPSACSTVPDTPNTATTTVGYDANALAATWTTMPRPEDHADPIIPPVPGAAFTNPTATSVQAADVNAAIPIADLDLAFYNDAVQRTVTAAAVARHAGPDDTVLIAAQPFSLMAVDVVCAASVPVTSVILGGVSGGPTTMTAAAAAAAVARTTLLALGFGDLLTVAPNFDAFARSMVAAGDAKPSVCVGVWLSVAPAFL